MQTLNIKWPPPGRYILAVSGGADSMVLLDLFARAAIERGYELTVAHFDHGLRADSPLDLQLIATTAKHYGLPVISKVATLAGAAEAAARAARHAWLEQIRLTQKAAAILTAHHQDDLLETSLLNLARGSGRLGLAPMLGDSTILRPLLHVPRAALRVYAAAHKIAWREDSTNADISNPRNFLRHQLLPSASAVWRSRYLELVGKLSILNNKIDQSISGILEPALIDTHTYSFPITLIRELGAEETGELILAAARRLRPGIQLDRRLIQEIAHFARTGHPHKFRPLRRGIIVAITRESVNLTTKLPH